MYRIIAFVFFCALFASGCSTGDTAMLNGEVIEVLSKKEELELISIARSSISRNKQFSSKERDMIRKQKPELKIRYTASRSGDAVVSWKLPGKNVSMLIRGTFLEPSAQWIMKIRHDHPEMLDFRKNNKRKMENKPHR